MKRRRNTLIILTLTALAAGCGRQTATAPAPERPAPEEETAVLPPLHPGFTLNREDLQDLTAGLPGEMRDSILEKPEYFLELTEKMLDLPEDLIRLVNKETGLDAGDTPEDLTQLDEYGDVLTLSRPGHRLRKAVLPSLLAMNEAARQEGLSLMISSAYRSYDYQEGLYNRYVAKDGREAADRYSARPGKSQHQLGTALDFGSIDDSFALTPEGIWLKEHAGEFGFSLSYPEGMESLTGYQWESWHYRYLSPRATEMEQAFFGGVQEHMLRFFHAHREALSRFRTASPEASTEP